MTLPLGFGCLEIRHHFFGVFGCRNQLVDHEVDRFGNCVEVDESLFVRGRQIDVRTMNGFVAHKSSNGHVLETSRGGLEIRNPLGERAASFGEKVLHKTFNGCAKQGAPRSRRSGSNGLRLVIGLSDDIRHVFMSRYRSCVRPNILPMQFDDEPSARRASPNAQKVCRDEIAKIHSCIEEVAIAMTSPVHIDSDVPAVLEEVIDNRMLRKQPRPSAVRAIHRFRV